MNLARVRGTVVATVRSDKVAGARWLLVEEADQWTERTEDRPMDTLVVAIVDTIDQRGDVQWTQE